jgi:hypothetical protein
MVQMREFHEGESIRVKEKNPIIPDPRRTPKYITGKVGKVRKVIGYINCPPDHYLTYHPGAIGNEHR